MIEAHCRCPGCGQCEAHVQLGIAQAALRMAIATFEYYAELHAAKGTPDGDAQARANRLRAATCFAALGEKQ